MYMTGTTLKFTYGSNDGVELESDATVGDGEEFHGFGTTFIDVGATTVRFNESEYDAYANRPFVGFTINDFNDELPDIIGLTFISSQDIDFSQVSFDANNISINLAGEVFNSADVAG